MKSLYFLVIVITFIRQSLAGCADATLTISDNVLRAPFQPARNGGTFEYIIGSGNKIMTFTICCNTYVISSEYLSSCWATPSFELQMADGSIRDTSVVDLNALTMSVGTNDQSKAGLYTLRLVVWYP